jgi:hypothetical protein
MSKKAGFFKKSLTSPNTTRSFSIAYCCQKKQVQEGTRPASDNTYSAVSCIFFKRKEHEKARSSGSAAVGYGKNTLLLDGSPR